MLSIILSLSISTQNLKVMNYYFLTAGIISMFAVIGHFTIGRTDFLEPVLNSDIDEIPKKVMHSIFHYLSVYMILTTILLLLFAIDSHALFENHSDVAILIAISYVGFAVTQIIVAVTSSIKGGIFRLFQWIFWMLIAVLSLAGVQ